MSDKRLYSEQIIDLYRNPINYGEMKDASVSIHESNPLCGDVVDVFLRVGKDGIISGATFTGKGCAISQASASLLTEKIRGKKIEDVERMEKEDVLELLGIDVGPARIKCALLPLKAAQMAACKHAGRDPKEVKWKA